MATYVNPGSAQAGAHGTIYRDQAGDQLGAGDAVRELGHRGCHGDLVEAGLLVVDLVRLKGTGACDAADGGPVQMSVGDGGQDVGEAAAGRGDGDTQVPGDPCLALGRVAGVHLVAHVDDAKLGVQGILDDAVDMCSVQAEGDVTPARCSVRTTSPLPVAGAIR